MFFERAQVEIRWHSERGTITPAMVFSRLMSLVGQPWMSSRRSVTFWTSSRVMYLPLLAVAGRTMAPQRDATPPASQSIWFAWLVLDHEGNGG